VSGGYCKFKKGENSSPAKKTITKFGAFLDHFIACLALSPAHYKLSLYLKGKGKKAGVKEI
jgi:hypothetical protein